MISLMLICNLRQHSNNFLYKIGYLIIRIHRINLVSKQLFNFSCFASHLLFIPLKNGHGFQMKQMLPLLMRKLNFIFSTRSEPLEETKDFFLPCPTFCFIPLYILIWPFFFVRLEGWWWCFVFRYLYLIFTKLAPFGRVEVHSSRTSQMVYLLPLRYAIFFGK